MPKDYVLTAGVDVQADRIEVMFQRHPVPAKALVPVKAPAKSKG